MSPGRVLSKRFYERSPEVVARELLGKKLVRIIDGERLEGTIVETEAYHGGDDPASRAFQGKKEYNAGMWGEAGRLFVYNVHKYWMLNVVSHQFGGVGGVLFRAIEPTKGIEAMRQHRPVNNIRQLTNGPGKLSVALGVKRELNGIIVTDKDAPVHILDARMVPSFAMSHRIGVTKDLPEELRFYVLGNRFVSR